MKSITCKGCGKPWTIYRGNAAMCTCGVLTTEDDVVNKVTPGHFEAQNAKHRLAPVPQGLGVLAESLLDLHNIKQDFRDHCPPGCECFGCSIKRLVLPPMPPGIGIAPVPPKVESVALVLVRQLAAACDAPNDDVYELRGMRVGAGDNAEAVEGQDRELARLFRAERDAYDAAYKARTALIDYAKKVLEGKS